jgi:hypothetical protein
LPVPAVADTGLFLTPVAKALALAKRRWRVGGEISRNYRNATMLGATFIVFIRPNSVDRGEG